MPSEAVWIKCADCDEFFCKSKRRGSKVYYQELSKKAADARAAKKARKL